ncbi:hypothetical protein AeNC1_005789 [Aphanomyces euteiches]|nr:hypothetical protein AeNC1_005789 [Aphanomyces euteiches]
MLAHDAASESELYHTVIHTRREKLRTQLHKVAGQKAFLRHEHRRLMLQRALLESEHQRFQASLASDWFCHEDKATTKERLRLQVGGQDFEVSLTIARKDPKSLLAALVASDSPLAASDLGCFCIDRDWNLFRLILNFLRDGILPNDPKLLRDLYIEADFWKFESLKLAIEQGKIQLQPTKSTSGSIETSSKNDSKSSGTTNNSSSVSNSNANSTKPWWHEPPPWWGRPNPKTNENAKKDERPDPYAWWKGSKYKGNDFAKFLADQAAAENIGTSGGPAKTSAPSGGGGGTNPSSMLAQSLFKSPTTATNPPAKSSNYPMLSSTWTSYRHLA